MIRMDWIRNQIVTPTLQDELRVNCPECGDDKYHMYCNLSKRVYICHKCGAKGKIVDDTTSAADVIAYDPLIAAFNKSLSKGMKKIESVFDKAANDIFTNKRTLPICHPVRFYDDWVAVEYLKKRGLSDRQVKEFYTDDVNTKVIMPIRNDKKELVYYVERNISNKGPRYKNAPWPKGDALYTTKHHLIGDNDPVKIIVEGVFDALAIARVGYTAIALLGKSATYEQLAKLQGGRYVVMVDKDAFKDAVLLTMMLGQMSGSTCVLTILPEKDPADMAISNPTELVEIINDGIRKAKKS